MAAIYVLCALMGLGGLFGRGDQRASWYQMWSLVEYLDEPGGLRLFVARLGADHPGLPVRSGETVEIHAELVYKARGGLERHYAFRVVTPAGVMEFRTPVWIEKLTMVPLEQRASTLGIDVTVHGDATAIQQIRSAV